MDDGDNSIQKDSVANIFTNGINSPRRKRALVITFYISQSPILSVARIYNPPNKPPETQITMPKTLITNRNHKSLSEKRTKKPHEHRDPAETKRKPALRPDRSSQAQTVSGRNWTALRHCPRADMAHREVLGESTALRRSSRARTASVGCELTMVEWTGFRGSSLGLFLYGGAGPSSAQPRLLDGGWW